MLMCEGSNKRQRSGYRIKEQYSAVILPVAFHCGSRNPVLAPLPFRNDAAGTVVTLW